VSKSSASELRQLITESRDRLQSAHTKEKAVELETCPLKGDDKKPPHSGLCTDCTKVHAKEISHSVPRDEKAGEEADFLKLWLSMNNDIGHPDATIEKLSDSGNMFGVLVCVDQDGKEVVLKSFSGSFDETSIKDVDGWCPSVDADSGETKKRSDKVYQEKNKREATLDTIESIPKQIEEIKVKIDALTKQLQRIGKQELTEGEWLKLGIKPAVYKTDSAEYQAISKEIYKPLADSQKDLKKSASDLEKEGKQLAKWLQTDKSYEKALDAQRKYQSENRFLVNFAGDKKSIKDACMETKESFVTNGQMGVCAAPKLLMQAVSKGLIPVGLSEFWYGKDTGERKQGQSYESCQYCRSIMGFMLHGLQEAQEKLLVKMEKALEEMAEL
jgi:hypothetical protein